MALKMQSLRKHQSSSTVVVVWDLENVAFALKIWSHHLIPVCIPVEMNLSALFVLMKWLKGSTTDIKMVNAADAWACGTTDYFIWTGEH